MLICIGQLYMPVCIYPDDALIVPYISIHSLSIYFETRPSIPVVSVIYNVSPPLSLKFV